MKVNIEEHVKSVLNLKTIFIREFEFKREGFLSSSEAEVNVQFNVEDFYEDNELNITLSTDLICENLFNIHIEMVGIFEVAEAFSTKLKPNAIAIMFPFLRSQISTLTTQPNLTPVILPVLNINQLINNKNETKEKPTSK